MQLVLDDQRRRRSGSVSREQLSHMLTPSHLRELVDGIEDQFGAELIDILVNDVGREPVAEVALVISACNFQTLYGLLHD